MMFWYGGGWAFWQVALMWAFMIAFWGLVIWVIYTLVVARRPGQGQRGEEHGAGNGRRILDERLARGEIDTDEYQRLRDAMAAREDGRVLPEPQRGEFGPGLRDSAQAREPSSPT